MNNQNQSVSKALIFFEETMTIEEFKTYLQAMKDRYIKCFLYVPNDNLVATKEEVVEDINVIDMFCSI